MCGHGVTMRIEDGALVIRDGFTHYPQQQEAHRYFKGDLSLPPRIVMVDGSGTISFDVLEWLGAQAVPLVLVNWAGEVRSVVGSNGYAADSKKVAWQEATRCNPDRRLAFCADLVRRKLAASVGTLEAAFLPSRQRDNAIAKTRSAIDQLDQCPLRDFTALRLIEATCASAYFAAWRALELRWKATARRPVPEDWRRFTSRTSLANNGKLLNVNASHPVNAMLNYAYAALETKLRIETIADGLDPTIGIMHHGRREKSAYVFDLMEPERPKVDAAVLRFIAENTFSGADFVITDGGVCRLSPQLARQVCEVAGGSSH
jgi:CRISPR-associated endonuclease Cas1